MKTLVRTVQWIVGILFIISGLLKANDPLGLSYKMQEFFELWNSSLAAGHLFFKNFLISFFEFLHGWSLTLAVCMITLEVIAGIALITGWKKKFILRLLAVLIVFFTFLTGYAYLSGKFTNCGCFGDCLPLSPLTSFYKDLALMAMIMILLAGQNYIVPPRMPQRVGVFLLIALVLTFAFQWYTLNYLPVADCLPFKEGSHLADKMKPPPHAIPDSFAIKFVYEKNGKKFEFSPENLPADYTSYKFIDRKQELVRKGNADPAIKGFTLTDSSGVDSLPAILDLPEAVLLFITDTSNDNSWLPAMPQLVKTAKDHQVPIYIATASASSVNIALIRTSVNVPVFSCDFTVVRTAARTNPTLYLLKKGTVYKKWSAHSLNRLSEFL